MPSMRLLIRTLFDSVTSLGSVMALALFFFMIFAISPRGQNLRMYQKDIYEWNKERMNERMSELAFKYKIVPYVDNGSWAGSNGVRF